MKKIALLCATTAFVLPGVAMAQSTGTIDAENNNSVVVTGTRQTNVGGVEAPDTSKTREVLNSTFIQNQTPGQSINNTINSLPGVSFTNNDPFGSAGGTLYIRGFDNTRISQTFDGIPLNDTGNYALFSNQQLDPELIEQVNVSLGSTDVDSPTAAATGSTVNYRTRRPYQNFAARIQGSYGGFDGGDFFRVFGVVDTGEFTPWGTRAFASASMATNDAVYGNRGIIYKQQYNAMIYQPIGTHGDFISVAGHYNQNRNNFFGSLPLRQDIVQFPGPNGTAPRVVGGLASQRFPRNADERDYTVARCFVAVARPGVADAANACGTAFEERYNPSNTGNIRINSRFTLADGLVLTVDPSYQYVKANGGGTVTASEGTILIGGLPRTGFIGNNYYAGIDLNGDTDKLDTVRLLAPSQTQTHRFGLISSLRYDIADGQTVRIAYSLDHARHRQTGELNHLMINGYATDVFPTNDPIIGADGFPLQKRDRLSYAILHQVAGEYRGEFGPFTVNAGLRAPFFKRILNNYCFAITAASGVTCFGGAGTTAGDAAYATANPSFQGPQRREFTYNKLLPNVGFTFEAMPALSLFGNYSKGLQVPGTDNLYQSFFYVRDNANANPAPETTDNFDLGLRYRSGKLQAQASIWYTSFKNRLASAYDRDLSQTIYRNLGNVEKYGIDGSIAYTPIDELSFYVFGSYMKSKIKDNIDSGANCTAGNVALGMLGCTAVGQIAYFQTAGRRESGSPVYSLGGRIQGELGPLEIGIQAKRTGARYVNDQNLPVIAIAGAGTTASPYTAYGIYGAKAPAYTLVDLDVRFSLETIGLNDKTYLQLNVTNLFDKLYVGGFDGGTTSQTSTIFANIGTPRTVIGSLVIGF
jgi:iron complex outermembrane receptor protein